MYGMRLQFEQMTWDDVAIYSTSNKVLREVTVETTAAGVWSKLKALYMTKSLVNKLYLKKKLYTFYMLAGRKIFEHINEFNKIVLDLANIKVKFKDEDLALLLLTSLPASYEHFVDTMLNEREALTLKDVMATLNSKEIKERSKAKGDDGEGLYAKGRTDRRDSHQSKGKSRPKSQGGRLKYILELKRNLISIGNLEKKGYIIELQSGKVKVINGSKVVLSGTRRRDNCVYSLDGHAVAGELNAGIKEKDSLAQVWHKRLGHISEARLEVMEKLFGKKNISKLDFCENYVLGKSHRSGLPKTFWAEATCTAAYRINRSPSTTTEKKTHMKMWSGHLALKCVLLGYLEGVKGYRLYRLDNESPKIITSRNMVIDESVMYKDTLKDSDASADKSVEELHVEDLTDYQLVRDRELMTRTKPLRFRDESNMVAYAFTTSEEEDTHGPLTYQEAAACEDISE
ncbi:retrotransposon protein, putative, ty1-copia subclass [Tanacetum coccineum]